MSDIIQCPIGIDANDPHTFKQGTGRLAFFDIMGKAGHYHEICQACAQPMNEPVVDGGLELAPDLAIYTVMVAATRLNVQPITMSQAMSLAHLYSDYDDVAIDISQDSSQQSYSWSEMAELSHTSQIAMFGWCGCEDNDGQDNPYPNCPITEPTIICQWCDSLNLIFYGYSPMSVETEYKCQDCHKKTYIDDRPIIPIIE